MLQILNSSNGFLRETNLLIIALLKFCYCYFPSKVNVCIKFSQFDTVMQEKFISCLFFGGFCIHFFWCGSWVGGFNSLLYLMSVMIVEWHMMKNCSGL